MVCETVNPGIVQRVLLAVGDECNVARGRAVGQTRLEVQASADIPLVCCTRLDGYSEENKPVRRNKVKTSHPPVH